MIAYFDTSAFVPLVVAEPVSAIYGRLWVEAARVVSVPILYTETRAALARAERVGRLSPTGHASAVRQLDTMFDDVDLVDVSVELVRLGGDLAQRHALRGFDAVHLAGGVLTGLDDDDFVFASGDHRLAAAASAAGLAVSTIP